MAEQLHSFVVSQLNLRNITLFDEEHLPPEERDRLFALRCNGYFLRQERTWEYCPQAVSPLIRELKNHQTVFFGPNAEDPYFSHSNVDPTAFEQAFKGPQVARAMNKYRALNESQAARIAFLLGGIVRHAPLERMPVDKITDAVEFTARMSLLGEERSGDAVTSAIAMYTLSGGPLNPDSNFSGNVFKMSEAIQNDPVIPWKTMHLGLSQVRRLHDFIYNNPASKGQHFPDISQQEEVFDEFPTVGAEFHFGVDTPAQRDNFWQRLAILNMSQYQRGSFVQFSRNDRDVIEIRMNPSVYPVTLANWEHLRFLMPELNRAYFFATIGLPGERGFTWNNGQAELLERLSAVGILSYAHWYKSNPYTPVRGEVNFGSVYLGQTVKVNEGQHSLTGNWGGEKGQKGQLSIFAGYGENYPYLTYFPSMILHKPGLLGPKEYEFLTRMRVLSNALEAPQSAKRDFFRTIDQRIDADNQLKQIKTSGAQIMELLSL